MTTKKEFKNHVDKCKKVIQTFGLTRNYDCAGFVLPDGKMIDFCKNSGREWRNRFEHDEVGTAYKRGLKGIAMVDEMDRYMQDCSAVRFRKLRMGDGLARVYVQSFKKPTEKQAKKIIEAIPGTEKFLGFKETAKRHHQCEYIKEKPTGLDVRRFISKCWR